MTISVDEIRSRFPAPKRGGSWYMGDYCVGGALCRFLGIKSVEWACGFPNPVLLSTVLRIANPTLTDAYEIAGKIIYNNDRGDFEDAWAWLAKGLEA